MKISSNTRVQVTVEISGSSYSSDWTIEALIKQSGDEAVKHLKNVLKDHRVTIVGEPKVLLFTHVEGSV